MPSCVPISDANLCIHIPTVDCTHGCGGNIDPLGNGERIVTHKVLP
jgi:hypothetical protein